MVVNTHSDGSAAEVALAQVASYRGTRAAKRELARPAPAGLFFCLGLRSHTHMDLDLENVIRQALGDARAAGRDHTGQTVLAVQAVQRARPDMTASDALAAVNLMRP